MSRFEYTDPDGDRLIFEPDVTEDGRPALLVTINLSGDEAAVHVMPDRVEEVIAGLRDMARQAGGAAPAPSAPLDMADVYRKLADEQEATAATDVIRRRRSIATARRMFAVELRRMAEGAGA
ncbi:hypothetical protein [Streptomyces erythrochromogenes]|uniref:hypothetical protein n=1 Tax=Streptomyces erythrochromogenes TaxID=285574 RepID=UPI0037D7D42B